MADVKLVALILGSILLVHVACMALCAGELASQATLPPCHSHSHTPEDDKAPMTSSYCDGWPAIEAKAMVPLSASDVAILPEIPAVPLIWLAVHRIHPQGESIQAVTPAHRSVLRI